MFAIFYVNLMKGIMGFCNAPGLDAPYFGVNQDDCANLYEGQWQIYDQNYENVFRALLSLFVLSTLEGWPDYMLQSINGGQKDTGPINQNNVWVNYLFVLFIMVGSIFSVNLFIAIIGMNFNRAQEKNKDQFLTD